MIAAADLLAGTNYAEPRILEAGPYTGHWVHLAQMMFTCAVMVSSSEDGNPLTRWCYPTRRDAKAALDAWNGVGAPPGNWIKQKPGDVRNPAYQQELA
ncbi:MAG: hypothetical protein K9G48_12745 [Reyranella sp.]|nr:hypothetical protein [Reyranella sp.]